MGHSFTYENFRLYFPRVAEDVVEYCEPSPIEVVAKLKDGSTVIYRDVDQTLRKLPDDPNNMTEEECLSEFSYRLRNMMIRNGINQTTLSERTGIPQPTLSTYLSGRIAPTFSKLDKIVRALGCSMDDLRYR